MGVGRPPNQNLSGNVGAATPTRKSAPQSAILPFAASSAGGPATWAASSCLPLCRSAAGSPDLRRFQRLNPRSRGDVNWDWDEGETDADIILACADTFSENAIKQKYMSEKPLTLIQLVSEQTVQNLLPVLRLRPDRLVHLAAPRTVHRSSLIAEAARVLSSLKRRADELGVKILFPEDLERLESFD